MLCQTDLTMVELKKIEQELKTLTTKPQCPKQEQKLGMSAQKKREQVAQDVLKSDESVKFYAGIPSLLCFTFLSNTLLPYTENMKYWDRNKSQQSHYQKDVQKKKPGRKRVLQVTEEFLLVLMRLKLGLMEQHLADIFAVTVSTVSRVYMTWVRFLAFPLKGSLLRWPSKEECACHGRQSFTIRDLLTKKKVMLNIPPFSKGKYK